MSDITIAQKHSLGATKAREETDRALARMAEKMGLVISWDGNQARLEGTGIKNARVEVTDDLITVDITLGLFAKPMKGMIEGKIREKFSKLG